MQGHAEPVHHEEMLINMGPQHPSTHGVLRLLLRLRGEVIESARFVIGYLHRCHEQLTEQNGWIRAMPLPDRLDYLSPITSEWAMALAAERLAQVEVPERAEWLRVLSSELYRIASHLVFVGTFAMDVGATTMFLYTFRERELLLDIFEKLSGQRMTCHYIRVGGVGWDLPSGLDAEIRRVLKTVESRLPEYDDVFTNNRVARARIEGVGTMSAERCRAFGASGPVARASGVDFDLRRDAPYGVYDKLDFDVVTGERGDCLDRLTCRTMEIRESIKLCRQALDGLPEGDIRTKLPARFKTPEGVAYGAVEGGRGECGYFAIGDGGEAPYRLKIRSGCFSNLHLIEKALAGWKLADVVAILGSIDIVLGDVDR
ncbi:MAG: NADH-quinone oxidoreductase subunit D [Armatimonadia bacterium]|nr:NADH-quinone oxidoreductase subunit D [Armatimonadia bacterium]